MAELAESEDGLGMVTVIVLAHVDVDTLVELGLREPEVRRWAMLLGARHLFAD